jgi:hypothetical protein
MTIGLRPWIMLSVLVLGLVGCSSDPQPLPAAPSPPVLPPSSGPVYILSNVTLSGVVFEETANGRVPIAGVAVYCEPCGAETHTWASTDAKGFYLFTGVWTDPGHFPTRISIQKDGYVDPPGLPPPTPPNPSGPGWREVVVNGDTRFDVQLVRQ